MESSREPIGAEWTWRGSAVWVGALAALAVGLIIGLIGYAVGAHQFSTGRIVRWTDMGFWTVVFSVAGAFFSFVVGGWAAARLAGLRRADIAMVHGAIVWLVALPLLLVLAALGATATYGSWYAGLGGAPAWTAPQPVDPNLAAEYRNTALATAAALLLGLVGSVLGGWMASGEPMTLTFQRLRDLDFYERPRRAA